MFGCIPIDTPLVANEKLKKEDGGRKVDASNYRSLIGNLFYLTSTRPDIMDDLSHIHLGAAKRVLRYIQDTLNYGIK